MIDRTSAPAKSSLKTLVTYPAKHLLLLFLTTVLPLLSGCGSDIFTLVAPIVPVVVPGTIRGTVFSGQQHFVVGASMQIYAANLSGYGNPASPLLPADSVRTNASGDFSIGSQFTCPMPDAPVYLVAVGGSPAGLASNPNLNEMAALGSCSALQASTETIIHMDEVTTVAATYALAPFFTGAAAMSTSPGNVVGLNLGFADVLQLVDNNTGLGSALTPPGAMIPGAQLASLANSLHACVESTGGTAGDTSACGRLFAAATPPGGTAPTDTLSAAINIVQLPGLNVAAIYMLGAAHPAYAPYLSSTPNDWTLAVIYTGGSFHAPSAVAVDASGNVWITNRGSNTITELAHSGDVLAVIPGTLSGPAAVALDASNGPWIANSTANTLTHLSAYGINTGSASGGGLQLPTAIAVDPQGNLWIADSGTNTVSEFTSTGVPFNGSGFSNSGITSPLGIAISTCERPGIECTF